MPGIPDRLAGRVCVITGAAGAIGEAVAGRLEREGATALFSGLSPDETARRFIHYPMGRFGTLAELAGTAAYLASDDSGFVTGAAFPVGGGIPAAFTVPT